MKIHLAFLMIILISSCQGQGQNEEHTFNGRALPENICRVVKDGATERPFTGEFWNHKEEGVYSCVACDSPLFLSDHKYASGSGWPSYYDVLKDLALYIRIHCHTMCTIQHFYRLVSSR